MGVNKKTYIKYKSFYWEDSSYYDAPSTGTMLANLGGPDGVDWDPSNFTMTAGGSGVTDFTTLFNVGALVVNAAFNELWATVVSVTATEVVFDGDLSGYNGGKFMESHFAQWTDPDEAFTLVLNSREFEDPSSYVEVTCWYPGSGNITACTHSAKVVGRDGYTLNLDRPLALVDPSEGSAILWDGTWSGLDTDFVLSVAFSGGTDYWYDTWFELSDTGQFTIGWFESWDSYGVSNSNQTEEQLYALIDKQVEDFEKVLDASYPETDWYIGTGRLGEYFY